MIELKIRNFPHHLVGICDIINLTLKSFIRTTIDNTRASFIIVSLTLTILSQNYVYLHTTIDARFERKFARSSGNWLVLSVMNWALINWRGTIESCRDRHEHIEHNWYYFLDFIFYSQKYTIINKYVFTTIVIQRFIIITIKNNIDTNKN